MLRTILTIGLFAVLGLFVLKLIFGVFAVLFSLLIPLFFIAVKIALVLLVVYFILRIVSPDTAARLRSKFAR